MLDLDVEVHSGAGRPMVVEFVTGMSTAVTLTALTFPNRLGRLMEPTAFTLIETARSNPGCHLSSLGR